MDAALRIFLLTSGDVGGHRVEFFWPPVNNETPSTPHSSKQKLNNTIFKSSESLTRFDEMVSNQSLLLVPTSRPSTLKLSKSKSHPINARVNKEWSFEHLNKEFCIYGIPLADLGEILFPSHRYHHKIFELKIDNILFISYPFCWKKEQRRTKALDGFNIVFAINLNKKTMHFNNKYNKLTEKNKTMWSDIIIKYVRIVQHEERRIGYLSSQLKVMNQITHFVLSQANKVNIKRKKEKENENDKLLKDNKINNNNNSDNIINNDNDNTDNIKEEKKTDTDIGTNSDKSIDKKVTKNVVEFADVVRKILIEMCNKCPIANDIKRIQEILSVNDEIKLLINGWVELHSCVKVPEENIVIRPYHTLLLLPQQSMKNSHMNKGKEKEKQKEQEEEKNETLSITMRKEEINNLRCIRKDAYDLLQQIPISGSQSLRLMISTANICSSFDDMASLTNIPLPTLFHFALHLKYWTKAQIIQTINKSSQFVIHPNANFVLINKDSVYEKQFNNAFPHRKSLIEELQIFNHPQMLSTMLVKDKNYIKNDHFNGYKYDQKQDFIFLIAWLLQRKLLIRLHKYINYINDDYIGNKLNGGGDIDDNKLYTLFEKVKPYFNGENHFLEIMFQTGLSSKKLQLVIDECNDQLISYSHPQDY